MLDKQIGLYSITTSYFFTEEENRISRELSEMKGYKKGETSPALSKKQSELKKQKERLTQDESYIEFEQCSSQLKDLYSLRKSFKQNKANYQTHSDYLLYKENEEKIKVLFNKKKDLLKTKQEIGIEKIKDTQEKKDNDFMSGVILGLTDELNSEFDKWMKKRRCVTKQLTDREKIMNFDNALFRIIGCEPDSFTEDVMVVRVYHYKVFESLIKNGFEYNGKIYDFWTSSAGQIRTKKCVFVNREILEKYHNTIYCGLTLDKINEPRIKVKDGVEIIEQGCNKNKYLAYSSLVATGTDEWEDLNIDEVIVVDDFETVIKDSVIDYIDYNKYDEDNLWTIERKTMDVTIPTMDGCGISLDYTGMFRMPWCKGLFAQFDFIKFIKVMKAKYKPIDKDKWRKIGKIKDIYGVEYDLAKDGIRHIMTKSQFKMWKYYDSWEQYKEYYKKYNCQAGKGNRDYETYKRTKISYQPLQTLYDLSDDELLELLEDTNATINTMCDTKDNVLNVLGAYNVKETSSGFQKSIHNYPELINDVYTKNIVKETKKSIVNSARYGKVEVDGMYNFLLPDVYAFAEWLILHEDCPQGLLNDGEVSCRFFNDKEEIDLLRSPHLNFSHSIQTNVRNELTEKWYQSNSTYTSIHSLYSLELMCDWDGDTGLITRNKTMIKAAKRIREKHDIVPLMYNLQKAKDNIISNDSLYQGMVDAYSNGNIGEVSNSITKIWNNGEIGEAELKAISYLTLWNNVVIDSAKTLWFPDKSEEMEEFLKGYTKKNLPYFFQFIKDKNKKQEDLEEKNDSVINRLYDLVSNPVINTRKMVHGKFDYRYLVSKDVDIETALAKSIINKFNLLNTTKILLKGEEEDLEKDRTSITIRERMEEMGTPRDYIVNVLVKYSYTAKKANKRGLWDVYGNSIYENVKANTKNTKICEVCGERFEALSNNSKYCNVCAEKVKNEKTAQIVKKSREKIQLSNN